jgi:hypothetical protein
VKRREIGDGMELGSRSSWNSGRNLEEGQFVWSLGGVVPPRSRDAASVNDCQGSSYESQLVSYYGSTSEIAEEVASTSTRISTITRSCDLRWEQRRVAGSRTRRWTAQRSIGGKAIATVGCEPLLPRESIRSRTTQLRVPLPALRTKNSELAAAYMGSYGPRGSSYSTTLFLLSL